MWLLLACQSPPSAPKVAIEPADPTGADTLVAVMSEESVDPDGDFLTYRYVWLRDGNVLNNLGEEVVPEHTTKGEVWELRVIASDGYSDAEAATDEVVIGNQEPTLSITLPELQGSGLALVATVETSDPDGDDVIVEASWTVDGVSAGVNALEVPALLLELDQEWTLLARASDGEVWIEESASIVIGNAQPVVSSVVLTPEDATVEDTFSVAFEVEDDDETTAVYDWYINGELYLEDGGDSLSASTFAKYDQVSVYVTASDDLQSSEPRSSNVVTIENSAPVAPTLAFTPAEPHAGHDDLVCAIDEAATDPDGDELDVEFSWAYQGVPTSGDYTAIHDGDTVDGSRLEEDAVWTCTVEVSDGEAAAEVSEDVEVIWACDASRGWDESSVSGAAAVNGSSQDVDGDGSVDLIVCDADDNVRIFWGDGTGSFSTDDASSEYLGDGAACVALGDLSGDGNDDIVSIDSEAGEMVVLIDTGSKTWNRVHSTFSEDATDVELGDVDLDGRDDLLYTSEDLGCLALRLGRGGASVGDATCLISQTGPFELADLDGDGLDEVVQVAEDDVKVYEFDTGGSAELKVFTVLPSPDLSPEGVDVADADGDGDLDVLAWGDWDGDTVLAVYFNDGDGDAATSFSECGIGALDSNPVGAADLDSDGIPDAFRVDDTNYEVHLSR